MAAMEVEEKKAVRESGTVVSWDRQSGTGRILADKDDQALFVHQVDLIFTGEGIRALPLWHQCEFTRSLVNGSHVACRVSKTGDRSYHFEKTEGEEMRPTVTVETTEGNSTDVKNLLHEKLKRYECVVTTNETLETGKIFYFHGEFRYGVIIPDSDAEKRVYADGASFDVEGSYLNVRKGVVVEYMTGKNKDGEEVAVKITGPERSSINNSSRVESLVPNKATGKRKNKRKGANATKKLKTAAEPVPPPAKEDKPNIPDGKNPVSIFYEFANSCNPKKTPSIKLVTQNTRASGMISDFTFEARLDDKPTGQGRARTKKDAKTYAAWFALEALEKESDVYKQEINRIKNGLPSFKKQMRSFTKRKWRGKFGSGPATGGGRQTKFTSSSTSLVYSPAIVVPQITPSVSLTTYNPSASGQQQASTRTNFAVSAANTADKTTYGSTQTSTKQTKDTTPNFNYSSYNNNATTATTTNYQQPQQQQQSSYSNQNSYSATTNTQQQTPQQSQQYSNAQTSSYQSSYPQQQQQQPSSNSYYGQQQQQSTTTDSTYSNRQPAQQQSSYSRPQQQQQQQAQQSYGGYQAQYQQPSYGGYGQQQQGNSYSGSNTY